MIRLVRDRERRRQFARNFGATLLNCVLEDGEFIALACFALLLAIPLCMVGIVVYHLAFDPYAAEVASRRDILSINPDKWFPRS
jgi:hypothetical protein